MSVRALVTITSGRFLATWHRAVPARKAWETVSEAGRDPQAIAALLLGDPRMIAACAEHDVQTIIRLMRSRGASLRGLATVTATSAGRIYEWEAGTRQAAGFEVFERISDGFRIPGRYLRLADRPWESQASVTMQPAGDDLEPWVPSRTVEAIGRFTRMDLMLDRRDATRAIATLAVGTPLIERVERWLTSVHDRPDHRPLGNIGLDDVQRFEQAAQLFRDWDDHFGGGLRRKAVVGQLNEVADLLRDSHPDEITRRLFRVMAHLAETAATMCWDSGRPAVAQRYYILALRASKEAREYAFGANILANMARQLLDMGRPDDALELVRLAQDGAQDRASATVWAMLHTREAWAYAKLGRVQAFKRATGKAEDALANAKADEDPHWIHYFDEAELAGVTAGRYLELAQADVDQPNYARIAQALKERALDLRRAESLRSMSLDQAGLAAAFFVQRDLEAGVSAGNRAIDLAAQTQSDRVRVKLSELHTLTVPHRRVPAVAEFSERLANALSG
jgi:tetratricopeptide (TPR) repeat protein